MSENNEEKWREEFEKWLSKNREYDYPYMDVAYIAGRKASKEEIDALMEEIRLLEESNEFYAGNFNGKDGTKWAKDIFFIEDKFGCTHGDSGKKARETKAKLEELRSRQ